MKTINLNHKTIQELYYTKPFSFEKTFYNPSRYKSGLESFDGSNFCMSLRFKNEIFGLKFYIVANEQLIMEIYSRNEISEELNNQIKDEISFRFSLNMDYSEFYAKYSSDKYLSGIIERNYGKHIGGLYSLYENLMISILLQNTTVKRTIDMTYNLLNKYGVIIQFNSQTLYGLWLPHELNTSDEELRALKVGYRSKNILRINQYFTQNIISDSTYRELPINELEKELLKIYGVGKQTVFYSMLGQFHVTGYLKHIPLWERKILSKYIFNEELCEEKFIVNWFQDTYDNWCGFALSMIIEDVFFIHRKNPIPWLKILLRE